MTLLLIGAGWAFTRLFPTGPPSVNIQGDNNVVLQLTGESLGLPPDEVKSAIERALSERDRRQVERDAAAIFSPSKRELGATLEFPGLYKVSPETAREVHDLVMLQDDDREEYVEPVEKFPVYVTQLNMDDTKTGWAGYVPVGDTKHRLRLILPLGTDLIRLRKLPEDEPIFVDGSILMRMDKSGEYAPKLLYISRLRYRDEVS
jgi:hypothetical protein